MVLNRPAPSLGSREDLPQRAREGIRLHRLVDDGAHTKVVNTVRREADGTYTGTLLDGRGFVAGLKNSGYEIANSSVYMAGAGGAVPPSPMHWPEAALAA